MVFEIEKCFKIATDCMVPVTFECKCSLSNTTVLIAISSCVFLALAVVRISYWGIEPQTTGMIVLNARFNSVGQDAPNGIDNPKGVDAISDIDLKVYLTSEPMVTTPPMSLMDRCRKLIQDQPLSNVHNVAHEFRETAVYPKSKLILCIPAKVGTSMNSEIQSELNKKLPDRLQIEPIPKPELKEDPHNISYYFCNDSWTKIFVVRDPLTRLVSGYLDKCTERVFRFDSPRHSDYHQHCRLYLLSIGIDQEEILQNRTQIDTEKNTLRRFTEWLLDNVGDTSMDNHFRPLVDFGGLQRASQRSDEMIKYWNVMDMHNKSGWDQIFKRQIGDEQYFDIWYKIRTKKHLDPDMDVALRSGKKLIVHQTGSQQKSPQLYNDTMALYNALLFNWRDYYVFNISLPHWIWDLSFDEIIADELRSFLQSTFEDKQHILPCCLSDQNCSEVI